MSTRDFRLPKSLPAKIRTYFTFGILHLFILQNTTVSAFEGQKTTPVTRFHVQQEQYKQKGVLVSRPKPLDTEIVKLIDAHKIRSLEDYSKWLKNHVPYKADGRQDQWASAQETLNNRTGDCEDYTFLNIEVLRVLGYKPRFIALSTKGKSHAICVFQVDGYYFWFDNTKLQKTGMQQFRDFAKKILDDSDYSALYELDLKTQKWDLLYKAS